MDMEIRGTTIVGVKREGKIAIAGDGQITLGQQVIMKGNAVKVRRIFDDKVVIGFAGSVSDAFSLSNRFDELLHKFSGNLMRSAVELAIGFRDDKYARKLDSLMIVADKNQMLIVSGSGEVIEPENGICAIGSGGNYALSAGLALINNTDLSAKDIAMKAIEIAGSICVFTNNHITCEEV